MRFVARLSLICNLAFLATIILRYQELQAKPGAAVGEALQIQPLVATMVILGYSAILVNCLVIVWVCIRLIQRKSLGAAWGWISAFLFLLAQLFYFFF
jgi:hypothetical protein